MRNHYSLIQKFWSLFAAASSEATNYAPFILHPSIQIVSVSLQWLISPSSLSDTELAKDVIQQVIGRDLPSNLTKVMKGFPDVLGQEVTGDIFADGSL